MKYMTHRRDVIRTIGMGAFGALFARTLLQPAVARAAAGVVVWATNPGECDPVDLERFAKETGIEVDYREAISDANQFFASAKPQLTAGLPIGYDLICISTDLVSFYTDNDFLIAPKPGQLPNVEKYLLPSLKTVKDAGIAIPFDQAAMGLCYNKKAFPAGISSWADLLVPEVKGKVGLYTMPQANIAAWALYLKAQGAIDNLPADLTFEEAVEVLDFLSPHIASGQLLVSQGENAGQKLMSGDMVASIAPAVNISQLDLTALGFSVPEEGAPVYIDRLGVPKNATNPDAAFALIDWWFEPRNAVNFLRYTLQNPYSLGAQEEMAKVDEALAVDPLIFPPEDVRKRLHPYGAAWDAESWTKISRRWTEIISG
jgi:spermidine/putrescine transport system substrate-binding protein